MTARFRRSREPRPGPNEMTLLQHLAELRQRLIVCLVAFVVAAICTYIFYPHILNLLKEPLCRANPHNCGLHVIGAVEGLGARLNLTAVGGLVFSSPVILFQFWRFVTPGLKSHERRYALPFVLASLCLFAFGVFVAWVVLPHALKFLISSAGGVQPVLTVANYVSLVLTLFAIFGAMFEFPVVLVGLEAGGVLHPAQLSKWRRVAIIAITVIAAVVTPSSDPFSMLALAVPMLVFYEASIVIGRLLKK